MLVPHAGPSLDAALVAPFPPCGREEDAESHGAPSEQAEAEGLEPGPLSSLPSSAPAADAAGGAASQQARRHPPPLLRQISAALGVAAAASELQQDASTLISFSDPRVRRGVRFHLVLRGAARVLGSSAGSADTFNLSQPTLVIDTFFSHNWDVPRRHKFMVLMIYFNLSQAVAAAVITLAVTIALGAGERAPTYDCGAGYRQGILAMSVAMPLFFLTLCLGHELRPNGPLVFLDKVCIHQTDAELKEHGIRSLGAFVCSSKNLLICYTDVYLQKLWTVYELATFLVVCSSSSSERQHRRKAHLVPVSFASFVLWSSFVSFLVIAEVHVMAFAGIRPNLLNIVYAFLVCAVVAGGARRWAKELSRTQELMDKFSFESARCAVDADRALVRSNIVALMKHYRLVEQAATREEVIDHFDEYVRQAVPRMLRTSLGRVGIPYQYLVPLAAILYADKVDKIVPFQITTRWALLDYLGNVTRCFGAFPIVIAGILWGTRRGMRFTGAAEVAFCGAVALCNFVVYMIIDPMEGQVVGSLLYNTAKLGNNTALRVLIAYHVLMAAVAFALYRPLPQDLLKVEAQTTSGQTAKDSALAEFFN